MGKFRNIINVLIQKILPKKFEIKTLNESPVKEMDHNQVFRNGLTMGDIENTPTFFSELVTAERKIKELAQQDIELEQQKNDIYNKAVETKGERKPIDKRWFEFLRDESNSKIFSVPLMESIKRLYEENPDMLSREDEAIEWILQERSNKSIKSNLEFFRSEIAKDWNVKEGEMSLFGRNLDDYIRSVVGCSLKCDKLENKQRAVILERYGLKYAYINAINDDMELPKELRENYGYENVADYKQQEKGRIMGAVKRIIEELSSTPAERKALTVTIEEILENKGLQDDPNWNEEQIAETIETEKREGKITPGLTRYDERDKRHMLKALLRGFTGTISANNNTGTKFIYRNIVSKDNDGNIEKYNIEFLEGEYRGDTNQEQSQ